MKKERGAITLITLVTILFMLAFLVSTFTIIMNRRQAQAEIKKETKEIYESDVENAEQVYKSYFAEEGETVPIRTASSLVKATNAIENNKKEFIYANNKIYICTSSSNYKLETNIKLKVSDYIEKYPDCFMDTTVTTSGQTTTVKRWKNIEYEKEQGNFKGIISYNGRKISETDTGNNIITHSELNQVEYIEGTGTQWIDTGIQPDTNTRFEMDSH